MPVTAWKSGLEEVASGVFAYIHGRTGWDVCNSGFIETDAGVMVIDAMMVSRMVQAYLKALRTVTDKPIRYLVNTHHHLDHCFGNQFYAPAEVVSHRGCRESMLARGIDVPALQGQWPQYADDWPEVRLTPATLTYEDKMVIHFGDKVIELLHPGAAHTYGDTLIYLPKEKVLFIGDVAFHYLTPLAADGHISRWIRVLERIIRHMDVTTVVPGHGPVGDKTALVETLRYLRIIKRTSRLQLERGASVEEAALAMRLDAFAGWTEPERVLRNVRRMYQELRGELPNPGRRRLVSSV